MYCRLSILIPLCFFLAACHPTSRIDHTESRNYPLGTEGFTAADTGIFMSLLPYKTVLDSQMDLVLAVSEQVLEKGQPEGLLGNFVADLCLERVNRQYHPADGHPVDFCFVNNGGLRAPLPKGNLTKRKIFELMPFENELIILTLEGAVVKQLADFMAAKGGMPVAGIRFKIGAQQAMQIRIGTATLDTGKTYKVVTSDYLANGGDNLSFLVAAGKRETTGLKLRDAIIQYLEEKNQQKESIRVFTDQRISYDQ